MATNAIACPALLVLIVKSILMTAQVTLVSTGSAWMVSIVTAVSVHRDSQGRDVILTSMSVPPIPVVRVRHVSILSMASSVRAQRVTITPAATHK